VPLVKVNEPRLLAGLDLKRIYHVSRSRVTPTMHTLVINILIEWREENKFDGTETAVFHN